MSYPILYRSTDTEFDNNGLGILGDCVFCEVTEEANGIFELAMQYPMDGIHFEDITDRAIIKAKADQFREPQLFRVYSVSKPMSGIVKVLAQHISYDLSGIPVSPFSAGSVALALSGLKTNAVVPCPFNFWTDKATSAKFSVKTPASIRSKLGGSAGSILDVYGGDYECDNYTVKLHNNRGMNRGVSIRYGKNLTDIKQDQNCSNVATGVYPYWANTENGELVELTEKIINAPGTYNFVKIRTVDFTQNFEKKPTEEKLRKATENYIKNNNIGVPSVSMTVSFAQLEQAEEYKHLKLLERVSLFDTVNVEFPALRVSATAKAVKLVYDVLADRVKSVTLGSVRANIADTIVQQQQEIAQLPNKSFLELAVEALTKDILGATGGSVRFLDTNEDGEPDTLYIADNPDPSQAVKVWRFNYEGWGASENGYNGPFRLGASLKTGIVADFITSGTLLGILVKAGAIQSLDGKINIDLNGGSEAIFDSGIVSNYFKICPENDLYNPLFVVKRDRSPHGDYFDMACFSPAGNLIATLVQNFLMSGEGVADLDGAVFSVRSEDQSAFTQLSAGSNGSDFAIVSRNGYLDFGTNENWETPEYINIGSQGAKSVYWEDQGDGTCVLKGKSPVYIGG